MAATDAVLVLTLDLKEKMKMTSVNPSTLETVEDAVLAIHQHHEKQNILHTQRIKASDTMREAISQHEFLVQATEKERTLAAELEHRLQQLIRRDATDAIKGEQMIKTRSVYKEEKIYVDDLTEPEEQDSEANGTNRGRITIYVNRHSFRVADQPITGAVLKELPTPPIGPDSDLIRIMHGGESDLFVRLDELVELVDGTEFFAVPHTIMAGSA